MGLCLRFPKRVSLGFLFSGGFFVDRKTDEQYMRQALDLARNGRGRTSPNPVVGAEFWKKPPLLNMSRMCALRHNCAAESIKYPNFFAVFPLISVT